MESQLLQVGLSNIAVVAILLALAHSVDTHKNSRHAMDSNMYTIPVNRSKLIYGLSFVATFLLCAHGLFVCYNYLVDETPWYLLQMFDVNEEHNLPTWFSGFNLLVATFFLWIATKDKRGTKDTMAGRWTVLLGVFCFLSIDEIAGIHESINSVIEPTWALGGAIIALVLGLYFIPFLKSLPKKTLIAFVIAGGIYVGGAVGMEIIGEPMESDSLIYNLTTMVEEGMEIFGIILFSKALLQYLSVSKINVNIKQT